MEHRRTSFAFLTEMLWVCGFFVLAACVFVLAFVKADQMSRGARDLNQAVLAAENAVEDTFAGYESSLSDGGSDGFTGETVLYFDRNWNQAGDFDIAPEKEHLPEEISFYIGISSEQQDGLLHVTASVFNRKNETLYSLNGAHFAAAPLPKGGNR